MRLLLLFILLTSSHLLAQETRLVTDFSPGQSSGFRDDAVVLGTVANSIAIQNNDDIIISDGTAEGTKILGNVGTNGRILYSRTILDDKIYVIIDNDDNDYSLVEIDLIAEEMRNVISGYDYISNLISYKGKLYCEIEQNGFDNQFASVDVMDGTTEKIFDLDWFGGMRDVVVHDDMIYSIHWKNDDAYLSKSDGTPGNVDEFANLYSGSDFSQGASVNMTSAGENLFFFYYSGSSNYAMYVSDGTEDGTIVLKEGLERIPFFDYDGRRAVGVIGNSIFFRGMLEDDFNTQDLWISDGTVEGTCTYRLAGEDEEVEPEFFTPYMDKLYFYGYNREGAWSPRKGIIETDGSKEGTKTPYDPSEHEDGLYYTGWQMTSHQDKLFFSAESSDYGSELYSSVGTLESITRVSELAEGSESSRIRKLTSAGENLFFIGTNPTYGRELYVYGPKISSTENTNIQRFDIHPNPAISYFEIPEIEEKVEQLMIYGQSGQEVKKITNPIDRKVNVAGFLPGWYMVRLVTKTRQYTTRFYKG